MHVFLAISVAAIATASGSPLSYDAKKPLPMGLHSQYTALDTNKVVRIFAPYHHTGVVQTYEISGKFMPAAHYHRNADRGLVGRDACMLNAGCTGNAYESLEVFDVVNKHFTNDDCNFVSESFHQYLTARDYNVSRGVIEGGKAVEASIDLGLVPSDCFFNVRLAATYGTSDAQSDACGERDPSIFSANAAAAIYDFCTQAITGTPQELAANYEASDIHTGLNGTESGFQGRTKIFVAHAVGIWGATCKNVYGVDWRGEF